MYFCTPLERTQERQLERTLERIQERTPERTSERALERTQEMSPERTHEYTNTWIHLRSVHQCSFIHRGQFWSSSDALHPLSRTHLLFVFYQATLGPLLILPSLDKNADILFSPFYSFLSITPLIWQRLCYFSLGKGSKKQTVLFGKKS